MTLSFAFFNSRKVHLGVCGSVAAYKALELMRLMQKNGLHVSVTVTDAACRFIMPLSFQSLGATAVYTQLFDPTADSPFDHLTPGSMADCFLIAPASASTIARLATGMADTMLSAQALAYAGPLIIVPAMNPKMWSHPATVANCALLRDRGVSIVTPADGTVACGDVGTGKLASLEEIYYHALRAMTPQDLTGKHVMLTIGPTKEHWDGVRFWSNPSSGKMGSALAIAAWLRGATVHAITGPGVAPLPDGIERISINAAQEMFTAAQDLWPSMHIGIFSAAVADYAPVPFGPEKFKKGDSPDGFTLQFTPNKDILATLGTQKQPHQQILGFAAETSNLEQATEEKRVRKNVDIMAGNYIGMKGSGFGESTNTMFICDTNGLSKHYKSISKTEAAWRLIDWLLSL